MPILIDGWNLIRDASSPIRDEDGDSLPAAEELIGRLGIFQESHRDPITVVFDSSSSHIAIERPSGSSLRIVAARDADGYIRKAIDNVPERQRRNLRVVSSDNDIFYYAKSAYAIALRSNEFWGKLLNPRKGEDYVSR